MSPDTAVSDFAARVLDVVETIPAGQVMSYGDIAEYLGEGGPRQVGRVMTLWGGGVAWWRVVHANGSLLAGHERAALTQYRERGHAAAPRRRRPPIRRRHAPRPLVGLTAGPDAAGSGCARAIRPGRQNPCGAPING